MGRCQTVSLFGGGGFFAGGVVGGSLAVVNSKSVLPYAFRTGMNCTIVGCCVGGINEGLAAARGTRDPINPAIACAVSGFLASVQRATPKRAGMVSLACAGAGIAGHYGWEEATRRFNALKQQRRRELGLALDEEVEKVLDTPPMEKDTELPGWLRWGPVRPITDEEIAERRRIDALRK